MGLRDLSRGRTFDGAASGYDRFRPRYPGDLFDDLAQVAHLSADSRILEVGCGPGIATESMIARGWSVLGVEPGAELARLASDKFDDRRFAVEVTTFDDWEAQGRRFDLVISATAFHWVAPAIRWRKAAEVLDDAGHIALVANKAMAGDSFDAFGEAARGLFDAYGVLEARSLPTMADLQAIVEDTATDIGALWEAMSPQGSDVIAGDLFEEPEVRFYPWSTTYSTVEALGLMATFSRYIAMDHAKRSELFERLARIIDEQYAGVLEREYVTVLATARRASTSPDGDA